MCHCYPSMGLQLGILGYFPRDQNNHVIRCVCNLHLLQSGHEGCAKIVGSMTWGEKIQMKLNISSCAPVNTRRLVFTRHVCEFPNLPSVKYKNPKQKFLRDLAVTPRIHGKYMNELSHMFSKYLPVQIPLLSV